MKIKKASISVPSSSSHSRPKPELTVESVERRDPLLEESENRLHRSAGDFQIMTAGLLIAAHVFAPPRVTYCRMAVDHRARIQLQQRQCQSHLPTPYRCLDSRTHVPYTRDMGKGLRSARKTLGV